MKWRFYMVLESKIGFSVPLGNKMLFLETTKENKCKSVVDAFIKGVCNYRAEQTGQDWSETMERCLADEPTRKDMACRLQKTTYELRETDNKHMRFVYLGGKNFGGSYDEDEIVFITE